MLRPVDRHDLLPAAGLVTAAVVLFQQPLRVVLDAAREIEGLYHLDLVPALVVLCFAFALHQSRRRIEARLAARAAAAEVEHHKARVRDLERLLAFGRAIGTGRTLGAVERTLGRELPGIVGDRPFWVGVGQKNGQRIIATDDASDADRDGLAGLAQCALERASGDPGVTVIDGWQCFTLDVGDETIGLLGIGTTAHSLDGRASRRIEAAAIVLAIALRNLRTLLETTLRSLSDPLTGCYNRAYALDALGQELRRAHRTGATTSLIMLDIDGFKQINDRHGHRAGDRVLVAVARTLDRTFRSSDAKCRYAGDEFLVILPDTPLAAAALLAERLRVEIAELAVPHGAASLPASASLGISAALPGELDGATVIDRADRAMYAAKRAGRNRCHTGNPERPATLMRAFLDQFPPSENPASTPTPSAAAPSGTGPVSGAPA